MAYRRTKTKTDLDVVGFLSVMSIVTGLICLILFVIALRIAMNPEQLKIISFKLFTSKRAQPPLKPKVPTYLDCWKEHVIIYSNEGSRQFTFDDLKRPGNDLERTLLKIEANSAREYVIVMVRPGSVELYRTVRNAVGRRQVEVGYDAVDADFDVNWKEIVKSLKEN
jgi:hypothetical protein